MKKLFASLLVFFITSYSIAIEGMWVPSLIEMFHSDMQTYGLKLTPEQIYSTNNSSLKDAIVQFGGGCTAEIVSTKSLLLTNHHCGFSQIQSHSSTENNYLKNGFWAKNLQEEKACPGLYVTFVKEIRDVTERVFNGVKDNMTADERKAKINSNIGAIESAEKTSGFVKAKIKPFSNGNQYFMLVTEDFNDVRLVGTPPNAIGKFGGDTDNWVWPRHTGDFSVFRIYANANNEAAEYSESNVPFEPMHSLPVSVKPKKVGDFTMVYGFPGSTFQNTTGAKLKFYIEKERPLRIEMRQKSLDIIKPAMNAVELISIQYASKQARIANAWKKWIGQIDGLTELNALGKKADFEAEYNTRANSKDEWKKNYGTVLSEIDALHEKYNRYELARSLFIEYFFVGPEMLNFSSEFFNLAQNYEKLEAEGKVDKEVERLIAKTNGFYKNYNLDIDIQIFEALTPLYAANVDEDLLPANFASTWEGRFKLIQKKSILLDKDALLKALENFSKKTVKKLQKDPLIKFSREVYMSYFLTVNPSYGEYQTEVDAKMTKYVKGMMEMFPERNFWPDANSTLRIAYGVVDGSSPVDGMSYKHYTTIDGIMQKYDPNNPDFYLTQRFIDLYNAGDFGPYTQDGELWTCFTASNHTTGGNSGSPVIDADGNLIGINFDRSWESTMSDFMFDETRCRNIAVDIRYVLWVIDKYGESPHLVEEMNIVK